MNSSDFVQYDAPLEPDAGDRLCPEDTQALDAVFGRDSAAPSFDALTGRPARVAALLALLDGISFSDTDRETLVQATVAKVTLSRHRRELEGEPVLVPDDEDALEALVSAEFQLARVPSGMRERAARHLALLGLLETRPRATADADILVESTLARVQSVIDGQQDRLSISSRAAQRAERGGRFFSFIRSRELISVAALILIATAMLTPLAQYLREYSRRTSCQQNMATAGWAFSQYAASNRDRLPVASSCQPGNLFWNVGKDRDQSNSANLFLLRAQNYASVEDLACAGQATRTCRSLGADAWDWPDLKQVSYSYQNMFARENERPSWSNTARVVVLADASPVIRRAVRHEVIYPFENSANHMGLGQNILWNDASSQWLTTPVLPSSDNLWLPRSIESFIATTMARQHEANPLKGTESPSAADDVFLGP